jgi:adenosylcobinamide-GDP ribazoletransferase
MSGAGRGCRQAVGFLTVVGGPTTPGREALAWFPLVGAGVGLAVGGAWWGAAQLWPRPVAGALAIVVDLALTGMLHLDGLCDTADGLLPVMTAERRLEVMRSPEVGAFGVGTAATVILLRWTALAAHAPAPLLVGGLWAASRTGMAAAVALVPYAREDGLAAAFRAERGSAASGGRAAAKAWPIVAGTALAVALAAAWRPAVGPAAVAAGTAAAAGVIWVAWRRVGGFTGDVLGAAGLVGETVGLLAAVARW